MTPGLMALKGNMKNEVPTHTAAPLDVLARIERVTKTFGGLTALEDINFGIKPGRITALIGPNGAGKSTLLNVISGIFAPDAGHVYYRGKDLALMRSHEIAAMGISRTFQILRLFSTNDATVLDNLMIGAHLELKPSVWKSLFPGPSIRRKTEAVKETAFEMLKFVGLEWAASRSPLTLSFGNQRLLEIARALMAEPAILLLDESASGLNDTEVNGFKDILQALKEKGITILIVEHNMKLIMDIADELVVLNFGRKLAEGTPSEIAGNPDVIKAYLGSGTMKWNRKDRI